MIKLTAVMTKALHFYSEDHTHEAVAYPKTGTRVALIRRGLLTPAHHAWEHELTPDGWAFLRSGQTLAEVHKMATEINGYFTAGVTTGPDSLDSGDARLSDEELAEKITRRVELLYGAILAVNPCYSTVSNGHALRMVEAHAWWLGLYRAERDRRSRESVEMTYRTAVFSGLCARGIDVVRSTSAAARQQAVQDLMHGEALEEHRARGFEVLGTLQYAQAVHTAAQRCEEFARRGTGHGGCDAPLDQHGNRPNADAHIVA